MTEDDNRELVAGLYAIRDAARRGADALDLLRQVTDDITREVGGSETEGA